MNRAERITVELLGRFGMFPRGVIFTMVGLFVVQAAIHHDLSEAQGMGAVFQRLAPEPAGHVMVGSLNA
jgi:hypothetical protein